MDSIPFILLLPIIFVAAFLSVWGFIILVGGTLWGSVVAREKIAKEISKRKDEKGEAELPNLNTDEIS